MTVDRSNSVHNDLHCDLWPVEPVMETEMRADVLLDLTAAVQQQASPGTIPLQSLVRGVTDQALLAETPTCTDQQRVKWSKAARELLTAVLAQMSNAEVLRVASCCV